MGLNESEYPGEQPKSSDLMLAMKDASDSEARNELEEERRLFQLMKTLNIGLKMGGLQRQENRLSPLDLYSKPVLLIQLLLVRL